MSNTTSDRIALVTIALEDAAKLYNQRAKEGNADLWLKWEKEVLAELENVRAALRQHLENKG